MFVWGWGWGRVLVTDPSLMYKLRYSKATMFVWGWGWGRVLVTDPSLKYKLRYSKATMFVWGWGGVGVGEGVGNRSKLNVQAQV